MIAGSRWLALLAVFALIGGATAPVLAAPQSAASPQSTALAAEGVRTNATADAQGQLSQHPPDPEEDVLGWENGYWYNETIDVTPADGLNDSELDAVVARGMARVEQIRRIEFEDPPPVEVIDRDSYRERVDNQTSNMTDAEALHQNVKYEALLMVNESTDTTAIQADNRGGGVGGFYDPSTGEIKIVSENASTPKMDEITLSQELFHALQDQRFNISSFNQTTRELHNARDGIIEGDGNYVDRLYKERCENEWEGTCVMPDEEGASSDFEPHFGLYQIQLQPYGDGPPFVEAIREDGGWEAVNAVYENPPASTEQTIHPEKYGEDEPTNVSVPARSDDRWRVLDINGSVDHASFGEAGLYVTLWYPGFKSQGAVSIIPVRDHINYASDGGVQKVDPYNYNHTYTAGWDGDKLVPYVTDDSYESNETGYVYRTVWDSPQDAAEFREGYQWLLEVNGAEAVDGRVETYRIPDDEGFGDAFYLNKSGDTFTIVNAPSVEELSAVHAGAAPAGDGSNGTADAPLVTTTDGPGFTGLLALVGLLVAITVVRRVGARRDG